ncbi:MAG: 1,4-beta-D-glucan glucohydrolase [Gammaproteobacteria bacterium]|nr:MAG: 1,4-beta-D-glucan glucohydrolase [Gammaproteobacteria bacterium]
MKHQSYTYAIIAISFFLLAACNHTVESPQKISKLQSQTESNSQAIALYSGKADSAIRVFIESPAAQQELVGNKADVPKVAGSSAPNADVTVTKNDKNSAEDALTFSWKDSWRAALNFEAVNPLDLTSYVSTGLISFDLQVIELAKGGLAFKTKCNKDCERQIPFLLPARDLIGKGWQHLSVPLKCFAHDSDNFSSVNLPFALETGGAGTVSVANVRIEKSGQGNVACPDYKTIAVTPSMLNEWWSLDWWQDRHQQKLDEVKALKAENKNPEIIFIGDSITQGWEKDGFNVWNRSYKKYNAAAFGFGGDRTENVLWRLVHGEVDGLNPKVAVLMFGTNNAGHRHEDPALTALGIKRNIDELQQRLPNTKILLLAIFPRDAKPDGELRQINNGVNAIISGFADNKKIFFLDVNKSFLNAEGVLSTDIMPDLLHPNEQGYEIWAKAMEPTLVKLLKK